MKKVLYFIPVIIVVVSLIFVAVIDGISFNGNVYWTVALTILAGIFLSLNKWEGCIWGVALGILIIYSGTKEHGQVINEIPIGIIVCVYYAIMGYIAYKDNRNQTT